MAHQPVLRSFDPPDQPWLGGHRGVDLDSPPYTPVRAAGSGTVVFAGRLAGRGVVSVDHPDGLRTTYEPVDAWVSAGEPVGAGDGPRPARAAHRALWSLVPALGGPSRFALPRPAPPHEPLAARAPAVRTSDPEARPVATLVAEVLSPRRPLPATAPPLHTATPCTKMTSVTGVVVLITGTGRSGTSTMSGTLHHLGLHVPGPYLRANASNPKGFFESTWAVKFHKRITQGAGISDVDSRPEAFDLAQSAITPELRSSLVTFLRQQSAEAQQLVVKDPRSVWAQALWRDAASEVGLETRYLTMLRHPAEVVGSRTTYYAIEKDEPAQRRHYQTLNIARWVNHSLISERQTRGLPRAFVRYPDLLERLAAGHVTTGRGPGAELRRRSDAGRPPRGRRLHRPWAAPARTFLGRHRHPRSAPRGRPGSLGRAGRARGLGPGWPSHAGGRRCRAGRAPATATSSSTRARNH